MIEKGLATKKLVISVNWHLSIWGVGGNETANIISDGICQYDYGGQIPCQIIEFLAGRKLSQFSSWNTKISLQSMKYNYN